MGRRAWVFFTLRCALAGQVSSAALVLNGHDAIYDLFQSIHAQPSTPHFVFITHKSCTNCYVMERMFHQASAKAKSETLNIQFTVLHCSEIQHSCRLNLKVDSSRFPDMRYWDSTDGAHIRGIDPRMGRSYRQRRDYPNFVHFARRFSHALGDTRPPTAHPVVDNLANCDFDKRMILEQEPCYILKNWPERTVQDWFRTKAVQRHDRNAFFTLKEGDRANTTDWLEVQFLPDGLHLMGLHQGGAHTYARITHGLDGESLEESLDAWIRNTPYPGVWAVEDDAQHEFLRMAPNKWFFALFMLGDTSDPYELDIVDRFRGIAQSETYAMRGTFGILRKRDWEDQAAKYGVNFDWFVPGDYHLVLLTENGTYWYEDRDYIDLDAMEKEKSLENLLVGHYPQETSVASWAWWYVRRVWRFITNWISYAFLGPAEALVCMAIVFAFTTMCALCIAAFDRAEQFLLKAHTAKLD